MTLSAGRAVEAFILQQTIDNNRDDFPDVNFDLATNEAVGTALGCAEDIHAGESNAWTLADYYSDYLQDMRCDAEVVHDDRFAGYGGRYYECATKILRLSDDVAVAFPYFYGGGKHGCPDEMAWLEHAVYVRSKIVTTIKWVDA